MIHPEKSNGDVATQLLAMLETHKAALEDLLKQAQEQLQTATAAVAQAREAGEAHQEERRATQAATSTHSYDEATKTEAFTFAAVEISDGAVLGDPFAKEILEAEANKLYATGNLNRVNACLQQVRQEIVEAKRALMFGKLSRASLAQGMPTTK